MSAPLRGASVLREQSPRSECDADDEDLNSKAVVPAGGFFPKKKPALNMENSIKSTSRTKSHLSLYRARGNTIYGVIAFFRVVRCKCLHIWRGKMVGECWDGGGMEGREGVSRDQTGGPRGACGVYVKGCAMMCSYRLMDTAGSHES
ncbi:hypothetical protein C8R43DRAFT_943699 [Mycena crocata]|nr:hypothetical protein C8R43DRAFT_943699 [Mycena crocata]